MPHLPRPAPRPDGDLRRRGAEGRRRDRADPRVPGPLPRARRRDQPDRRRRPRRPAHPRAAGPAGRRHGHRADPGHRPESRGRGDRHVPRPHDQADGPAGSPAWPAACRSAATWSTPTRSRSAAPSREDDCSMSDATLHAAGGWTRERLRGPDRRPDRVLPASRRLGRRQGRRARRAVALPAPGGLPAAPGRRPARRARGHRAGRALRARPGPEPDVDELRERLATCSNRSTSTPRSSTRTSREAPVATGSPTTSPTSSPTCATAWPHYRAGRTAEALWWWQFSYFSTGATAPRRLARGAARVVGARSRSTPTPIADDAQVAEATRSSDEPRLPVVRHASRAPRQPGRVAVMSATYASRL